VGGRINGKAVSFRHQLRSGDTVEVLTQNSQTPKRDWLNLVKSAKAKAKIRLALKETQAKDGLFAKEMLERRFKNRKLDMEESIMGHLIKKLGYKEVSDFYKDIAEERLDANTVIERYIEVRNHDLNLNAPREAKSAEEFEFESPDEERTRQSDDVLVIDRNLKGIDYKLAQCCRPIYGDDVFGFVTVSGGITIHRADCPNAPELRKRFGYRIVKARWSGKGTSQYAIVLRIVGNDDIGIVSNITNIISKEDKLTMRNINIDSHDGLFNGNITVLLDDTSKLEALMKKLRAVKGVK
ncbi:ACT domain-containing protein, partial [Segatella buccae]